MFKNRSFLIKVVKDTPDGSKEVEVVDVVRSHFERHRTAYLIAAGVGIAGITWYITRGRHATLLRGVDGSKSVVSYAASDMITVRPFSFFSTRQTVNVISVVEREGRGHPGYLIRCLETNEIFRTQGEAARNFNVHGTTMSRHMTGMLPDVKGLHFERLTPAI